MGRSMRAAEGPAEAWWPGAGQRSNGTNLRWRVNAAAGGAKVLTLAARAGDAAWMIVLEYRQD